MTPPLSAPIARVRGLRVSFSVAEGRLRALRGVDLDIWPGEVVALVGESGSGKTMIASALLGLLPEVRGLEVEGCVEVGGVDMLAGRDHLRRDVRRHMLGAVFQDPLTSLNPTMKVGRQLRERGISRERARSTLEDAGVPEPERRYRQYPFELSGGLRQRAMIAMALGASGRLPSAGEVAIANRSDGAPALIVADEPTTALDVSVQAEILLLFDRLRREHGCALLLVTHDLGVAASIADRIVVLYAGRVCEIGSAAEVLAHPMHPYSDALLGARLSVQDTDAVRAIPGSPPDPLNLPTGCAFAPRCSRASDVCRTERPEVIGRDAGAVACFHPLPPDHLAGPRHDPAATVRAAGGPSEEAALELVGVVKSFPVAGSRERLFAVNDVTLGVRRGMCTALVGESGSGKTTLLRLATGLLRPDRGEVRLAAEEAGPPQLVFQDAGSSLTSWLSIGRQIGERLRARGYDRSEISARTNELLGRVGLDERASRARPRQLSGGQRQRAAIARALASEPSLLVCDEPVSALDASLAVQVLELIDDLRVSLGVSILLVTHDLAVAHHIAQEVAVMYRGTIVERGPTELVFGRPAHPYTQGLLASSPSTEPGVLAPTLLGEPPSAIGQMTGCPFATRCPKVVASCRSQHQVLREVDGRWVACQLA